MKTRTKSQIIELIDKNGPVRPKDLVHHLSISPQAVHRHLKSLVLKGVIEPIHHPPRTAYILAGRPDYSAAYQWVSSRRSPEISQWVCQTRDVFSARLSHFVPLRKQGVPSDLVSLLISTSGEIGNNSFDHNLGQWTDVPGCWFQFQKTKKRVWVFISDRGRGIFQSLLRVRPDIRNDQEAIEVAYRERISGRSPEKRGNGLKFVASIISAHPGRGLFCISGKGQIALGEQGSECESLLKKISKPIIGTTTVTTWEIGLEK